MRYRPAASVTVIRVFSISAALLASTTTPAIGAPDGSLTTPPIAGWPKAATGTLTTNARIARVLMVVADTIHQEVRMLSRGAMSDCAESTGTISD